LRYLIRFASPRKRLRIWRKPHRCIPAAPLLSANDMEKFGCWPGTFKHCYTDGWLEEFLSALEENSSWFEDGDAREFMASHLPLGRADLPAASYHVARECCVTWVEPRLATIAGSRATALCGPG